MQEKPPMYSNPELDMIQKDIDELVKERLILETEIAQKEADLKIRSGEVKSLQVNVHIFIFKFILCIIYICYLVVYRYYNLKKCIINF